MHRNHHSKKAWDASVPAIDAPPGFAPSQAFMRSLSDRFPEVHVRWDNRPRRGCFVLWEKTRSGRWAIIQDVPKGHPLDNRVLDHLTLCRLAQQPGIQSIIERCDETFESKRQAKIEKETKHKTDWDKVMWHAKKLARDELSTPTGVFSQVTADLKR